MISAGCDSVFDGCLDGFSDGFSDVVTFGRCSLCIATPASSYKVFRTRVNLRRIRVCRIPIGAETFLLSRESGVTVRRVLIREKKSRAFRKVACSVVESGMKCRRDLIC